MLRFQISTARLPGVKGLANAKSEQKCIADASLAVIKLLLEIGSFALMVTDCLVLRGEVRSRMNLVPILQKRGWGQVLIGYIVNRSPLNSKQFHSKSHYYARWRSDWARVRR